jgi:predicted DCC family thiol-disulfide oxidoreductase YuxK
MITGNSVKMALSDNDCELIYDWQCPACSLYCDQIRIQDAGSRLHLINARSNPGAMKEVTARGYDIDEGMVLKTSEQFYYGAEAIHQLALMASPSNTFNRLNCWIFSSRCRSELLYPVLRNWRRVFLKLLRRTKVNNLGLPNNEKF